MYHQLRVRRARPLRLLERRSHQGPRRQSVRLLPDLLSQSLQLMRCAGGLLFQPGYGEWPDAVLESLDG